MARLRPQVSEQAVAEVVVAYLEAAGAEVFQEVEVSGGVADIVAKVQAEIWIVEVKTSLSLALIGQAMERRRLAHRVYIAAPHTRTMRDVGPMLDELGIGLLEVFTGELDWAEPRYPGEDVSARRSNYGEPRVRTVVDSRRWNSKPVALAAKLQPEHKTHAKAGAVGAGGRWTPFRNTCEQLARVVRAEPGITVKAAIEKIKHHYATSRSAVSAIATWAQDGKVPGVEVRRSHGTHGALLLHPTEAR